MRALAAAVAGLLAASPVAAQKAGDRGFGQSAVASSIALTRRAVIIGINRYLHFTNLRYADSDAVAFYNYLTSESGGAVPPGNIRLLLDSNATAEAIDDSLGWLMRPSHGGDDAIIYFAGHGDVDTTSGQEEAYFLASDAVTNRYRTRGTLSLKTLNAFVEGIARQGRHVLLFTDACRSGWLVGQKSRATRTIAALLGEEDGVGKLLSSGAGEPSQENDQWGGGHGVFTYFLIAGLEGLADERPNGNGDGIVTLWELEKYVSDNVLRETKQSQSPVRVGFKGQQVARVHRATLRAALVAVRGPVLQPLPRLSGGSGVVTPPPDPALARPLGMFHAAIARRSLLEPRDSSAWEAYRTLTTLRSAAPILTALRDTLVTALRDDVEGVIRDYQAAGRSQPSAGRLRRAARELSRAAELLGPHSGLADSVRARQLFFEGYAAVREGRYDQALDSLQQSLALEPDAANVHNALGFAYLGLSRLTDARLAALKMQLQPHFLCNALNMIAAHIHDAPDTASAMLQHLSTFLRATLRHSGAQEVPLREEVSFLQQYIDIMEIRFQGRLRTEVNIASDTLDILVPNLVLQPIVENALEHGASRAAGEGRIEISARRDGGNLVLQAGTGPPTKTLHFSTFKDFNVTERWRIQFRICWS